MTATEAFRELQTFAEHENIDNSLPKIYENMSPGDAARQGDILTIRLEGAPDDIVPDDEAGSQLAPGNTKGSRHILRSMDNVKRFRRTDARATDGPILQLIHGEMVVDHPEHAANIFCQEGWYSIRYQRSAAEELARRLD